MFVKILDPFYLGFKILEDARIYHECTEDGSRQPKQPKHRGKYGDQTLSYLDTTEA